MKPETAFSRRLVSRIMSAYPETQVVRIESNYTQQGIPDLYICYRGMSLWVETKIDNESLNPLQVAWHRQHRHAGGMVLLVREKVAEGGMKYYTVANGEYGFITFNSLTEVVRFVIELAEGRRNAQV